MKLRRMWRSDVVGIIIIIIIEIATDVEVGCRWNSLSRLIKFVGIAYAN